MARAEAEAAAMAPGTPTEAMEVLPNLVIMPVAGLSMIIMGTVVEAIMGEADTGITITKAATTGATITSTGDLSLSIAAALAKCALR